MSSLRDKANLNSKNKKLQFCPYCGAKLIGDARFCTVCGEKITVNMQDDTSFSDDYSSQDDSRDEYSYRFTFQSEHTDNTERQSNKSKKTKTNERETVYEGKLHKCPNCGEVLDSYTMRCPACGYEIRDAKSVSSVQKLSDKLERISARQMDSKVIFSREKRTEEFNEEKEKEKASLIRNFAIPNTKEDILEFVILASTNLNSNNSRSNNNAEKEVNDAWRAKLEQAYRKAEATMKGEPEFDQIKNIYDETMNKVKSHRFWYVIGTIALFNLSFFMMGWANPLMLILSILVFIGLAVVVVNYFRKSKQ